MLKIGIKETKIADAICQETEICGITLSSKAIKLSLYAEDTTLILDGSEESFLEALNMIEGFGNISGLKVNSSKTEPFWTGSNLKAILNFVLKIILNGLKRN